MRLPQQTPSSSRFTREVWRAASKESANAQKCLTSNWEGLNSEVYYAITGGIYATETEANAALEEVQAAGYSSAYVKYSGNCRGNG